MAKAVDTGITRVEEWTKDIYGMISTVVVEVREGDMVWISDEILEELHIPQEGIQEVVDGLARPRFVWSVPYEATKTALALDGWTHVRPA